jgi:hypothetical protein
MSLAGPSGRVAAHRHDAAQAGSYSDSQPTYSGWYAGKLTDGKVSASRTWGWSGEMGWISESGPFSLSINLG